MARSSLFPASVQPGKPILPPCPPGWTTLTFGDVLEIVERPIDLIDDVEYQLVTAKRSRGGVVARSCLLGRDVLTKTQFQIVRDDFLMSNRQIIHGGCGIIPPALDGAVVSNEYSVLRPKSRLLLEFLGYLSHSIYFQQTCFHASVGVDVEKMIFDCERWLEFRFNLPPLHEQRRIAEILSSVDEAIAAMRAVIEQTRKVKQSVLERLLSKGIGHSRFKQTEIGEIPEEWEVAPLSALLDSSTYGLSASMESAPVGTPILRMGNIQDGELSLGGLKYAVLDKVTKEKYNILRGDLLFNRTNSRELVGKIAIARETLDASFASYLIRLRVNRFNDPFFIHAVLSSPRYQNILRSIATPGASQANINATKLGNTVLPVPPIGEQRDIAKSMDALMIAERANLTSLHELGVTKSALMSDLLTGRKRVTDALPMAAE